MHAYKFIILITLERRKKNNLNRIKLLKISFKSFSMSHFFFSYLNIKIDFSS